VLPKKQTGGGAEERQALLDFSCVSHAVARERHDAVSVEEMPLAFWALPRCSQVLGDDEVFGLQRVKHHDLREEKVNSDRRIASGLWSDWRVNVTNRLVVVNS
jgi:hypothetical protein